MMWTRGRIALLITIVAIAFAGAATTTPTAGASAAAPYSSAHKCGPGYVHARLSWGHKCLRAGQFCKVGNREYLKYGFYCPRSGHLRRRK
jgi:hypothetical protein